MREKLVWGIERLEKEREKERDCVDERGGWVLGGRGEIDG